MHVQSCQCKFNVYVTVSDFMTGDIGECKQ